MAARRILAVLLSTTVLSCASTSENSEFRGGKEIRLIRSIPQDRPDWLNSSPSPKNGVQYFIGISNRSTTEAQAKDYALADALKKAAAFAGVSITAKSERNTKAQFKSSETADPNIAETGKVLELASGYFSQFVPEQWHIQQYGRMENEQILDSSYQVSVLLAIPDKVMESAIAMAKKKYDESMTTKSGLSKFWEDHTKDGVILINDGSSAEDFGYVKAAISEYLTQHGILVIQNSKDLLPGHPALGVHADYTNNPDVLGNKSLAGSYAIRIFVKDKDGNEIVGKTISGNASGLAKTPQFAKQASIKNFLEAQGPKLLQD